VCGASLLGGLSNHWVAIVDSGSSCLSLPDDIFDGLWGWVPANCSLDTSKSLGRSSFVRCYLQAGTEPSSLPVLSFRLEQHGRTLQLPLEDLLLPPDAHGAREFCIRSTHRTAHEAACPGACPSDLPILFGAMALQRFFAVFEMRPERSRVGLAAKRPPLGPEELAARRGTCAVKDTCKGQQHYSAAANKCVEPNCHERYFQVLDESRGVCTHSVSFQVMMTFLIGCFAAAELGVQQFQLRLPREAEALAMDADQ